MTSGARQPAVPVEVPQPRRPRPELELAPHLGDDPLLANDEARTERHGRRGEDGLHDVGPRLPAADLCPRVGPPGTLSTPKKYFL